jgi:hypothetical protein
MGGDGGVIASNRRYMRGAGTADTVGDGTAAKSTSHDPAVVAEELARDMTTCALTGQALNYTETIVACTYGRLYMKEAAVEALLKRKSGSKEDFLGRHIKGLKDLYDARFHTRTGVDGTLIPICPVTEKELNGKIPAFLVLPGTPGKINVVSERVLLDTEGLLNEYGPVTRKIRLAPPKAVLDKLKEELAQEDLKKKDEKQKKKRKHVESVEIVPTKKGSGNKLVDKTREKVSAAIRTNEVLSSLFTKAT